MTISTPHQLNVLVVDDDELILHQISQLLSQVGVATISTHSNGQDALSQVRGGRTFDLAFIDLHMPEMDGIEVIRHLASEAFDGALILLSGEEPRILQAAVKLAKARELKVLGSLPKPVTKQAITSLLNENISQPQQHNRSYDISAADLQNAIRRNELALFFQPKVRTSDRHAVSAEVLCRWQHPTQGNIPPDVFIPLAEESGLIDSLTIKIYEHALEALSQLKALQPDLHLAINISADNLNEVDLPEQFEKLAKSTGIPCTHLTLEVTESRLMKDLTTSLDILTRLRMKGFALSIDDFGTGYSSLTQLSNIPFTELKIDRAFVRNARTNHPASAILQGSVEMARKLGMSVVAEGVEDEDDWQTVQDAGCDLIQGYFIARPMPLDAFAQWLPAAPAPH